ncbi:hypothetical protein D3C72_610720 [compost metagenome]
MLKHIRCYPVGEGYRMLPAIGLLFGCCTIQHTGQEAFKRTGFIRRAEIFALIRSLSSVNLVRILHHFRIPLSSDMPRHQVSACVGCILASSKARINRYVQIPVYGTNCLINILLESFGNSSAVSILRFNQLIFLRVDSLDEIQRILSLIAIELN